ncbi:MAG: AI-2E family transporter [Acidimicrobiia bacterium]
MTDPDRPVARPTSFHQVTDVAWRVLVLGLLVLAIGALLWKLRIVVLPVLIALLLSSVLSPLVVRLEERGWKSRWATLSVFLGFLFVIAGALASIVPATVDELEGLGDTLETALDDVEDWMVDGPLHLDRREVEDVTDDPGGRLSEIVQQSSDRLAEGVRTVGETLAGALLALVLTFLFLKDGRRFQDWSLSHLPGRHRDLARAAGRRALDALAGFIRGAAILGVVEGVIIGLTLWIVGAPLAAPVALLTFLAAFFPIVGAITAGAIAVLVALAGKGLGAALVVLAVAIVVQQLDGDLLAPWIYGRSLQLHPAVILVALAAGGALGGIIGAFVAVPVSGAIGAISAELWDRYGTAWTGSTPEGPSPEP